MEIWRSARLAGLTCWVWMCGEISERMRESRSASAAMRMMSQKARLLALALRAQKTMRIMLPLPW